MRLPAVVQDVPAGHRLVLTVATTDLAYQLPSDARTYTVALAGGAGTLTVPTVQGTVLRSGHPMAWLLTGVVVAVLLAVGVTAELRRRRRRLLRRPDLGDVPVTVTDLVKEYRAVLAMENLSPSVKMGSESRIGELEKRLVMQRLIKSAATNDEALQKERAALQQQYAAAEKAIADYQANSPYAFQGVLQTSTIVQGKYALVNPATLPPTFRN